MAMIGPAVRAPMGNAYRVEHAHLELLQRLLAQIVKLHVIDKRGKLLYLGHREGPLLHSSRS
jgi:hypothetical protein